MTLSIAGAYAVFGASERLAALVCAAWVAALVGLTLRYGRRALGPGAGTLAAVLTAGSAFCAAQAFEVRIHGFETVFGAAACWVAALGLAERDARRLFAAGVLAGGAWLCRETAAPIPAVLGLASLAAFRPWTPGGLSRARLVGLAASSAGFLAILAVELAAYALAKGDAFHRLRLSANHEAITAGADPSTVSGTAAEAVTASLQQPPLAVLLTTPNVTPFLLGAAGLSGLALVLVRAPLGAAERWAGTVIAAVAAATWVFSSYVLKLEEPLYAPMLPYACGVFGGWAVWRLSRRFGLALLLAPAWVLASAMMADLRDYDEWAEPRWLADALREERFAGPVATDWLTARRTDNLLTLTGDDLSGLRRPDAICEGMLVLAGTPVSWSGRGLRPAPDWTLLEEAAPRRRSPTRRLLRGVPVLGKGPLARFVGEAAPVRVFRAGPSAGPCG